jgi:hypothetical protein
MHLSLQPLLALLAGILILLRPKLLAVTVAIYLIVGGSAGFVSSVAPDVLKATCWPLDGRLVPILQGRTRYRFLPRRHVSKPFPNCRASPPVR